MKKLTGLAIIFIALASFVYAEEEDNKSAAKHEAFSQFFGLNLSGAAMKLNDGEIYTASFGISYDFYFLSWLSINSGILFHQEIYTRQPTDNSRFVPEGNPFCFTIPIGIHFNIPKAEWIYTGVSFAFNIPISNANSPDAKDFYKQSDIFCSLPIDLGFDFIKAGKGGSRLFLKVTPTFYNSGIAFPAGIVWQVYNWRIFKPKVEVPKVEVNIPPPPSTTIIIINPSY